MNPLWFTEIRSMDLEELENERDRVTEGLLSSNATTRATASAQLVILASHIKERGE